MGKHKIRENKTCQNCGRFVAENFCPHCGQKNSEIRHTFIYLIKHFVSDLLHYDSSVWSTTKLLLFSPATLSIEYIRGKRKSYVDPIKLYIFISFLAFFIPGILPDKSDNKSLATIRINNTNTSVSATDRNTNQSTEYQIYNTKQLDSLKLIKDISAFEYYTTKVALKTYDVNQNQNKQEKINEFILHNLSKVLFIYMPLFAFWLWIFHNKKKFLYFDSGIFTLHYFSFLLLFITILNVLNTVFEWLSLPDIFSGMATFATCVYSVFYFFRAHRLFYGERRIIANLKAFVILSIDMILILVILILFAFLALFMA